MSFTLALLGTILVNLPFGWWREGQRKLSPRWFVAVHGAVPFVIVIRMAAEVRLGWTTVPFLLLSYFLGQHLGARMRRGWTPAPENA